MLIQLSTGDWKDPATISGVVVDSYSGEVFIVCVEFKHHPQDATLYFAGSPKTQLFKTKSKEEAETLRDRIANQVNTVLYQERKR
jgi:hypothetical protein